MQNHDTSEGFAVNDSDVVVGYSANTQIGPLTACRWVDGQIEPLDIPMIPNSQANDINELDLIVGWMGNAPSGGLLAEAFVWSNGKASGLGMPRNATNSTANAISNSGIICGAYTYSNPQGGGGYAKRALAWINGQMIDLGVLPDLLESRAFDVNDAGEIVGYCSNPPLLGNDVRAFLWRDGVMIKLDSVLAPEASQYQVWYAYGINNSGQIAATVKPPGLGERAAVLTPVPPRAGDTNCDWSVDISDLLIVINAWGPYPNDGGPGSPDLNNDGAVNVLDLLIVIQNWG